MANQYGTKAWAKWAHTAVDVSLSLLQEPAKKWDENTTYLESAKRSLGIIKTELEEVMISHKPNSPD